MTHHRELFRPGLVATDIDGTIVPVDGTLSDRTRAALHAGVAAGLEVVLVTGRPPRWMAPVTEALRLPGTASCANGSVLLDTATSAVVDVTTIDRPAAAEAIDRIASAVPDAVFAAETPSLLLAGPGYEATRGTERAEGLAPTTRSVRTVASVEEMLDDDQIFKVVALSPGSDPDAMLGRARAAVGDVVHTTRSAAGRALVELGPAGVTKASALARYAHARGITRERVVAFGDMPNDVEMLRWAGRSFAMAGGHPAALSAAGAVAPPADEDGVAQVLESMLAAMGVPEPMGSA